jgi:hypothetical protein
MRRAGYVARRGKREVHTGFWWGDLREGNHLGDPGVDGMIILKWIFKTWDGGMDWIELAQVAGCCEYGNEPQYSIKCVEFLD